MKKYSVEMQYNGKIIKRIICVKSETFEFTLECLYPNAKVISKHEVK